VKRRDNPLGTSRLTRSLLAACSLAATATHAASGQQTPPAPAPVVTRAAPGPLDSLHVFEALNGTLLRPGIFTYRLSSQRDTLTTPLGIRTVSVSETTMDGMPAWLVAESRTGTPVETMDSLYLTRADLSPERWVGAVGRAQLAASFTRDSMFAAMQTYQGRSSFAAPMPPGALLTPGMVDRVVELLPLEPGFRVGASLLLFEMGAPRTLPAELTVERDESCALPDRPSDCWVVLLRSGMIQERLWVTKTTPRVVKTEQGTGTGLLTSVLTSETAPVTPAVPLADVSAVAAMPPESALYPPRCPPPCTSPR
jgi:hypothetical protein